MTSAFLPCCSFAINIGHDADNIAMHFNPRFDFGGDENTIVYNSKSGGDWGEEIRECNFPFQRGEECKVCWEAVKMFDNCPITSDTKQLLAYIQIQGLVQRMWVGKL